ncbi:HD domain-containing protein [Eubacteriales bacterium OttesenSCG-928-N14]|nr:HD domain-containing protein [Eubacteriales bacterium OttesenSCG-928-N14]
MVISLVQYHRMMQKAQAASYRMHNTSKRMQILAEVTMIFFSLGFVVGATHVILVDVEPIFMFVGFVFFAGSIFVASLIRSQIALVDSLNEKAEEVMKAFVSSIEMKDRYTQGHSHHVYQIVEVFFDHLPEGMQEQLNRSKLLDAALLHDIGKIGISDKVLNKIEPLTDDEWAAIRMHPVIGQSMLKNTYFNEISDWILFHHERMDGKGYLQLTPAEIPLESRIIAVADTYSAITTKRIYRQSRTHDEAVAIMEESAGTQLDDALVRAFMQIPPDKLKRLYVQDFPENISQ